MESMHPTLSGAWCTYAVAVARAGMLTGVHCVARRTCNSRHGARGVRVHAPIYQSHGPCRPSCPVQSLKHSGHKE